MVPIYYKNVMDRQYHILNGDALKEQFPKEIGGEKIVVRECLVDGDVKSDNLEELFQVRASFIATFYGDYTIHEYYTDTVSEFEKIESIPAHSTINLWFEDDLFCQVNFWFVVNLIFNSVQNCEVFLIRPKVHTQFGFGGLNNTELVQVFTERVQIKEIAQIASLWGNYRDSEFDELLKIAGELKEHYPFILSAAEAQIMRIPTGNYPGRPKQALLEIMEELRTEEFEPVFREFVRREYIYGFGDLQVKRLLDEIKNNR